jgi:hypothetical protein
VEKDLGRRHEEETLAQLELAWADLDEVLTVE